MLFKALVRTSGPLAYLELRIISKPNAYNIELRHVLLPEELRPFITFKPCLKCNSVPKILCSVFIVIFKVLINNNTIILHLIAMI